MKLEQRSINTFLDDLGAPTAAPGGGAAIALSAAMGAALIRMACNLTIDRPGSAQNRAALEKALVEAEKLGRTLTELIETDPQVIEQLMTAYRLPKQTKAERDFRQTTVETALQQAAQTQLEIVLAGAALIRLAGSIVDKINPNAWGDLVAAAYLIEATIQAAQANIAINLELLAQPEQEEVFRKKLRDALSGVGENKTIVLTYSPQ